MQKKRIKKTALFMIFFGCTLTALSLYYGYTGNIINNLKDSLGIVLGLVFGLVFLIFGVLWFTKHRPQYHQDVELKRYGKKIQARFMRSENMNHTIDGHDGVTFFLKEEQGERVFQTKPVFSEYSIKWLEEHLFDVYIDSNNGDNYYIDLEKHFGEPKPHK